MVTSSRRRSRRTQSCESQATEHEHQLHESHSRREVITSNDDTLEECIRNSLKAEWRELSQKVLRQLGAKEMASLYKELDVLRSGETLNSVVHLVGTTNTTVPTAGGISSPQVQYEDGEIREGECVGETVELKRRYRATALRSKEREEALRSLSMSPEAGKDPEFSRLNDELTQVRADLEVSDFRLELERNQKEEA
ncbi:hypothetical protein R1flu_020160 [Riccia fluitans]|uniref:Uncharacterized protein n=1 Tax=Riccia fluitans TaxID=41844 RepID=A0ABD1ZL74_9MARC